MKDLLLDIGARRPEGTQVRIEIPYRTTSSREMSVEEAPV